MPTLRVEKFSCIDFAEIDMARFTILIGEQASGKSVISKLLYFFNDLVFRWVFSERDIGDVPEFMQHIEHEFKSWFPPLAWGDKKFLIEFRASNFIVSIRKKNNRGKSSHSVQIEFSEAFLEFFNSYIGTKKDLEDKLIKLKDERDSFFQIYELRDSVRRQYSSILKKRADGYFVSSQLFIPAGRSFFTSLGKAISAFERSGMLDPITMRFGEFYLSAKQRLNSKAVYYPQPEVDFELKAVMNKFFGGEILFKRGEEFVSTDDGRLIPIAYLSSGQQELLPLWLSIEEMLNFRGEDWNIYIEEPEAHIFPSTQSVLIESLAAHLGRKSGRVVLTTHSPYVLAKFNNLIKAGSVGSRRGRATKVSEIIRKDAWLKAGSVGAYSIDKGRVSSIIDADGLIDAEFLDGVSGSISEEYMNLVEIECA